MDGDGEALRTGVVAEGRQRILDRATPYNTNVFFT